MLLNIVQKFNKLHISKIGKDKKLKKMEIHVPSNQMFEWSLHPNKSGQGQPYHKDSDYKLWSDGSTVYRKPTKYLNSYRIIEFLTKLPESERNKIYEYNEPTKIFCDIETEYNGRPVPKMLNDPQEKITAIGWFNPDTMVATVYGIREMSGRDEEWIEKKTLNYLDTFKEHLPKFRFKYEYFSSESDMLMHMFTKVFRKHIVFTGWNFVNFDWTYMIKRARKLGIDPEICADDNRFYTKNETPRNKLIVDYREIFRKWSDKRFKVDNYSLEEACQKVLGQGKIKYDGSIQDLYETDHRKYIYYNVVDTVLVYLIDIIDKSFMTFKQVGQLANVEANSAFSPVKLTEAVMCREFYKDKLVMNWVDTDNVNKGKIEGAFVLPPKRGIHRMVTGLDFASLYPHIMMMFNISAESYLGKKEDLPQDVLDESIVTVMGTVFSREESVTKRILKNFYAERKYNKKVMFQYESEIKRLQDILKTK